MTLSSCIEWLGLRFFVPDDWEIARHSVSPEQGSLALIDRRRQRLCVSWTQCKQQPNLTRLLEDYQHKQREQQQGLEFSSLKLKPYRGFSHLGPKGERVRRVVRYEADYSRLVEVLFVDEPGQEQSELFEAVVRSLELTHEAREARHFKAFALDVIAPERCRLTRAVVKPADASFDFVVVNEKQDETNSEARVRRLGLARTWYDGDLRACVEKQSPKVSFSHFRQVTYRGHDALEGEGFEPGPVLPRLLRLLRQRRVLAFACPAENAVYLVETTSPKKRPLLPSTFEVRVKAHSAQSVRSSSNSDDFTRPGSAEFEQPPSRIHNTAQGEVL